MGIWIALPSTEKPAKPKKLSKQSQVTTDITRRQLINPFYTLVALSATF